jgi:uncharacterized membrane protein YgcG
MLRWTHVLIPALLLAWLLPAGPARAVFPPPIKDDGKFFKPETLEKANKKIREIYEKYRKDVIVETLPSLTADQEKKMKDEGRQKFFAKFALDRSKELGLNGVYIVFSKNPQHYQIHMDPGTQKKAFTASDRAKLAETIVKRFKEGNFDAGLLDGLDVLEAGLKANTK